MRFPDLALADIIMWSHMSLSLPNIALATFGVKFGFVEILWGFIKIDEDKHRRKSYFANI